MLDVLGAARHRPAIEPDDLPAELVMEPARDDAAEPARDAGDHDLARRGIERSRTFTRRHASRSRRPRWIIDWIRLLDRA